MKKLTILLITIFIIYLIYSILNTNKVNLVIISDIGLNDKYLNKNKIANYNFFGSKSILDVFKNIKNNKTIKDNSEIYYLKKLLRESDVLVINIGMGELNDNFSKDDMSHNYVFFAKMYDDIIKLIDEVKRYAYGKIIFFGYYNPTNYYDANIDRYFYDIDIKLSRLMSNNNIIYIDLYELIKGNNYKTNNSYTLNNFGNKKVSSIIDYYFD